ncbi:NUDIX hydrolase [bacterium]|nr:MAG: NUDIX hydrolase [bacterium]
MRELNRDRARQLLQDHRPFDALERQHLSRTLELVEGSDCCGQRDHFKPGHLTASGSVLSPDRRSVLLIEHAKLERWLQPGGHLEADDADFKEAARREVREETGLEHLDTDPRLEGLFDVDVHLIPSHGGDPEHLHFDLRYLFIAPHAEVTAGDGVRSARFWPLDGIQKRFDTPSLYRPLLKIRRSTHDLYSRGGTG